MNDKLLNSINEYNRILNRHWWGARSRPAREYVRLHQDEPDFLELAQEAEALTAIRRHRRTMQRVAAGLAGTLLVLVAMSFLAYSLAAKFRNKIINDDKQFAKRGRLLLVRDEALEYLRMLESIEDFARDYPPDSPWGRMLWNQEIAYAWARYAFLDWQWNNQDEKSSTHKMEELERRIAWIRRHYPKAGEVEVLEGRKILALPGTRPTCGRTRPSQRRSEKGRPTQLRGPTAVGAGSSCQGSRNPELMRRS